MSTGVSEFKYEARPAKQDLTDTGNKKTYRRLEAAKIFEGYENINRHYLKLNLRHT